MTEPTDNGWPEKYSDPRDRPHPRVLRITIESFEAMKDDTIESVGTVAEGEEPPAVVSFATVGELRSILTDRRIELLRTLLTTEDAAESITGLAEELDRDYSTVHDDVSLLAEYGLVYLIEEGRSKRPYLPYERIHLDVEFVGEESGEEHAPA